MRKITKVLTAAAATVALVFTGALVANAATSGTVSITQGVGSFAGSYYYDAYVSPGQTGTRYAGTLRSTTTQLVKFEAQVEGYAFSSPTQVSNGSTSINRTWYDGAALYTNHSQARVCEVAVVFWVDYCTTKTYNR